jgi:hypothetical protein
MGKSFVNPSLNKKQTHIIVLIHHNLKSSKMRKSISSVIASLFGLITKEEHERQLKRTAFLMKQEELEKHHNDRHEIQILCIETNVGKPFISVTNEWDNPMIGIVLDVEFVTAGLFPIAKVYDFVTNKVLLRGNTRIPFNRYNLEAILRLDPYQRWNLVTKSELPSDKPKINPDCFSPRDILDILEMRNFAKIIGELHVLHFSETAVKSKDFKNKVFQLLKSNGLNMEMTQ